MRGVMDTHLPAETLAFAVTQPERNRVSLSVAVRSVSWATGRDQNCRRKKIAVKTFRSHLAICVQHRRGRREPWSRPTLNQRSA
jgi:hypothetical protein